MTERVQRWNGTIPAALVMVAAGVVLARPVLLLGATIPVAFLAYSYLTGIDEPEIAVQRSFEPASPVPGEHVEVTIQVRNVDEHVLPDVRVVDRVPDGLAVIEGSPRLSGALRPGESTTATYSVQARRGEYEFDSPRVRTRSLSGSSVSTTDVPAGGEGTIECELALTDVPLAEQTIQYVGRVPTDTGGAGVEFHSLREYRRGDPMNRIDWRRVARTGELSTVEFREHRAATVVLVIDARSVAAVSPRPGAPSGIDLSAYAAERALVTLIDAGNRAGVTAIGTGEWIEPGATPAVEARASELFDALTEDETGASSRGLFETVGDGGRRITDGGHLDLPSRLPPNAQVVFLSPVVDDYPLDLVRTLQSHGHAVTVLSPDVTGDAKTTGTRVEAIERRLRLLELRERGSRVVDWAIEEPLNLAIARALRRWVR